MRKGLEHLYRNKPFFFFLVGEEGVRKLVWRDRQIFDQKKPITMVHKHTYSIFFFGRGRGEDRLENWCREIGRFFIGKGLEHWFMNTPILFFGKGIRNVVQENWQMFDRIGVRILIQEHAYSFFGKGVRKLF